MNNITLDYVLEVCTNMKQEEDAIIAAENQRKEFLLNLKNYCDEAVARLYPEADANFKKGKAAKLKHIIDRRMQTT